MNILYYCSEYPPCQAGGIGTVTKIVAESLTQKGHNVYVVGYYPTNNSLPEYSVINGVYVYRYNKGYRTGLLKRAIFTILSKCHLSHWVIQKELTYTEEEIKKIIKNKSIDILELTDYYSFIPYSTGALKFCKFSVPTVLRVHGSASFLINHMQRSNAIISENDATHFKRCDHLCAVSKYSLKYIQDNFDVSCFKSQSVIYNPIDNHFINATPVSKSDDVLFVGKLIKEKGCFSLLKAFNICAARYPKMRLHLVGAGDIEKAMSYIDPKFIDRVHFLGYCTKEQIKCEIDNCIFACIPSFFENFSMAVLEIMGRQRALIYTERTSGNEIIDNGVNGYTVNPEDVSEIAEKMSQLYKDINLRNSIANKGFLTILDKFSEEVIVQKLETNYKNIINGYCCND